LKAINRNPVFAIRGNTSNINLPKVVYNLLKKLDNASIQYKVEKEISKSVIRNFNYIIKKDKVKDEKYLIKNCDFLISIGGDGTFLASAKLVGNKNIPIIGVNLGKLGFLAETSTKEIFNFIKQIIKGKYGIDERTVIQAKAENSDKIIHGINEIVINQDEIVKTIEVSVYYNNQLVNSYHADGIIIATPTGSTGYSLSAGGPIVYPKTEVFILSPLSPHTLTARPVILPDYGTFKIKIHSKIKINAVADGNDIIKAKAPITINIKKADYKVKIAKSSSNNYFKVLTSKLLWGEDKRKKSRN
jgi:NAD+ kinase